MREQIIDAVSSIESDIFESTGCEYFNITYSTNGYMDIVSFCNIRLWDSESDDRLYLDDNDESIREPIDAHLRRRLKEEIAKMNLVVV